jgi:hypothetical protein
MDSKALQWNHEALQLNHDLPQLSHEVLQWSHEALQLNHEALQWNLRHCNGIMTFRSLTVSGASKEPGKSTSSPDVRQTQQA